MTSAAGGAAVASERSGSAALDVAGVSHSYGKRKALDNVSFSVKPASFTVLLGLNGAGKSTLFSLITRLYGVRSGAISIFGWDVSRTPGEALRRLGVVFQPRTLDLDLTVEQNLMYHAALHGIGAAETQARLKIVLAQVDMQDRVRDKVRALSGGQMRRIEIARALLHRPHMLLLDEATVGLDVKARAEILSHVRGLVAREKIGVLWATHLIDEVEPGDDVVVLDKGKLLDKGNVADVVARAGAADMALAFNALTGADQFEVEIEMSAQDLSAEPLAKGFSVLQYAICLKGIVWREALRFLHQRERFVSALVRPLIWLFIFAAGFRSVLGVSIIPPYDTYVLYDVYITPGLVAMIQLFNGMQSSLSMVYDREMGNMRTLLVSPLPRAFLLISKLIAGMSVSILQVYAFLLIAYFWDIQPPTLWGYVTLLPALVLGGLMFGALGLLLSSAIKQLENFAGVMNFVIFPMYFASTALYPLWRVQEGSPKLALIVELNPFTYAVELVRFAFYGQINPLALAVVLGATIVFLTAAIIAYDPSRGMLMRREG